MKRKCIVFVFIIAAACTSLQAKFQPDDKFLNSAVVLREGVLDLGEMQVKDYVELVRKAGRSDGTPAGINGWAKEGNTFRLQVDIGEPIILEFDYNGTTSQLQPVQTKQCSVSPMEFTMQLTQNMWTAKIRAAQKEAEPIIAEIESLDTKEQQQLSLLEKGPEDGLMFVGTNIQEWKQQAGKLNNKQKELSNKIGPILTKRVELKNSFDDKIKGLEFAKEDFGNFKKNSIAAGAKLINDAIVGKNLDIDLLPRDGIFLEDSIRMVHQSNVLYSDMPDSEDAGSFIVVEYRFTVFANATEEGLLHGVQVGWDRNSISSLEMGNGTRGFFHFPKQIEDESVKKAFAKLYQDFDKRIRQEAGEKAAYELPDYITFKAGSEEIEHQRDTAIEKFDYKNEMQSEDYQKLLSQFREEMAELQQIKKQLADANAKISRKEKAVNCSKSELQQVLCEEIKKIFVEKRESLDAQLKTIAERIKGE